VLVVGIANDMNAPERLRSLRKADLVHTLALPFAAYDASQLDAVVRLRLRTAAISPPFDVRP
jgi:Cdc6-like AAA superfamily ATPase